MSNKEFKNNNDSTGKPVRGTYLRRISKDEMGSSVLFEVAWEVCNQVGGIFTVIQSKIPSVIEKWQKERYILLGPYFEKQAEAIFEPIYDTNDPIARTVEEMNALGYKSYYGHWLTAGRPKVVLFDPMVVFPRLAEIKYLFWEHHGISTPPDDCLINQVIAFGHQVQVFFEKFIVNHGAEEKIIAHFHEWMAGTPIPEIRRNNLPVKIVFTTHATLLGRYLAMNDPWFYENLNKYNWAHEAKTFNVETIASIERAAAHGAHVFTTVSEITAQECKVFLGREPEVILPNALNVGRFEALHEFQNLHRQYKERINEFALSHFFQSYSFDLNKTVYFFTSGRYEYKNKGYDLVLEALARLNWKMKQANTNLTVVTFIITRNPFYSMNSDVLRSKAMLDEIKRNCEQLQESIAEKLFYQVTSEKKGFVMPDLNTMLDDTNVLRLRNNLQSWRTKRLPPVVTHNLVDEQNDSIMNFLKSSNMLNNPDDRVKIVYHPDFISTSNPLFHMEYYQFIRGCHLGVFPSYYEPWGYTPMECIASGIPSITSDLAGFGSFAKQSIEDYEKVGIYILRRKNRTFDAAAEDLSNMMFDFLKQNRRQRIMQRNRVEASSEQFDWHKLGKFYDKAYGLAIRRM
ncbi:MAG: glycogen/starch synthase [Bacteroidales bacterium]|nr:glycogen/starch synthase [Bacteroidales bacterium]